MTSDNYIARPLTEVGQRVAMQWFHDAPFMEIARRRKRFNSEFYLVQGDKSARAARPRYHRPYTPNGGDAA